MEESNRTVAIKHHGSCHCGKVRFEVEVDRSTPAGRCNCSICTKVAATSSIIRPEALLLGSPEAELGQYAWGGMTATRFFCKQCGIHCFLRGHLPELGGDYVSVNLNCLDDIDVSDLKVVYWDGRHNNWEAGARDTPWPIAAAAT
jgi:hypothetical protein